MIEAGLDQPEAQYGCPIVHTYTKSDIVDFLDCGTTKNIRITLADLDLLIEGGHPEMKEAYPNWSKPEARKIRNYLHGILNDAERYKKDKGKRKRSRLYSK